MDTMSMRYGLGGPAVLNPMNESNGDGNAAYTSNPLLLLWWSLETLYDFQVNMKQSSIPNRWNGADVVAIELWSGSAIGFNYLSDIQ